MKITKDVKLLMAIARFFGKLSDFFFRRALHKFENSQLRRRGVQGSTEDEVSWGLGPDKTRTRKIL